MSVDREAIYSALFSLLSSDPELSAFFVTISRQLIRPPDLIPEMQPALFLIPVGEHREPRAMGTPTGTGLGRGMPFGGRLTLYAHLVMFTYQADTQGGPLAAIAINQALQMIDDVFVPKFPDGANGTLTLGKLVEHCWIEKDTKIDAVTISQQAFATVPIAILVPQ